MTIKQAHIYAQKTSLAKRYSLVMLDLLTICQRAYFHSLDAPSPPMPWGKTAKLVPLPPKAAKNGYNSGKGDGMKRLNISYVYI